MKDEIDKSTLVSRTAERMKLDISQGQWNELLPGYRALSSHYTVSKNTILAAIDLLEQWKVIAPSEVGKRRKICLKRTRKNTPSRKKKLICISGNIEHMNRSDFRLMNSMITAWEATEGKAHRVQLDYYRFKNPSKKLKSLIKEYSADALFFLFPPEHWSGCAATLKPCFFLGGSHTFETPVTMVGCQTRREIAGMVTRLNCLGHQQIMVAVPQSTQVLVRAITNGIADALGTTSGAVEKSEVVQICQENIPDVWKGFWQRSFMRIQPTAIILLNDEHWLSLQGYCHRHKIRIPEDLSVLNFNYNESFLWCDPQPSMQRFSYKKALSVFSKWMKGGLRPMGKIDLETELFVGETMMKANQK